MTVSPAPFVLSPRAGAVTRTLGVLAVLAGLAQIVLGAWSWLDATAAEGPEAMAADLVQAVGALLVVCGTAALVAGAFGILSPRRSLAPPAVVLGLVVAGGPVVLFVLSWVSWA